MEIKVAKTQKELFGLVQLRTEVFVLEQQVDLLIEQDKKDYNAIHYVALIDDKVVGCLRILEENDFVTIGRLAVKKDYRNQKIGKSLLLAIENDPTVIKKGKINIHAQIAVKDFYLALGYSPIGSAFYEANIEHIIMEKIL